MHDRSGETSGAGDTPSAAVRAGEVPELASRGELAMSKSLGHEKEDARHVPTLSAEQGSARLEKTLGARWRALSDAEKSRLVESARASFQEAEQRKRLAKADPGASEPSADPARDEKLAPAERATKEKKLHQARDAPGASPASGADAIITASLRIKTTRYLSTFIMSRKEAGELHLPASPGHLRDDDEPSPRPLPSPFPLPLSFCLRLGLSPLPLDLPDPLESADGARGRNWLLPRLLRLSREPDLPREERAEPLKSPREPARDGDLEFGWDEAGAAAFRSASVSL